MFRNLIRLRAPHIKHRLQPRSRFHSTVRCRAPLYGNHTDFMLARCKDELKVCEKKLHVAGTIIYKYDNGIQLSTADKKAVETFVEEHKVHRMMNLQMEIAKMNAQLESLESNIKSYGDMINKAQRMKTEIARMKDKLARGDVMNQEN